MHGRLAPTVSGYRHIAPAPSMPAAHWRMLLAIILMCGDVAMIGTAFLAAESIVPWLDGTGWQLFSVVVMAHLSGNNAIGALGLAGTVKPLPSAGRSAAGIVLAGAMAALLLIILGKYALAASVEYIATVLLAAGLVAIFRATAMSLAVPRPGAAPADRLMLCEPHESDRRVPPGAFDMTGIFAPDSQNFADYQRLAALLHGAERVLVRCAPERRRLWVEALSGMNVGVEIEAPELADINPVGNPAPGGTPVILVRTSPLGIRDRVGKRVFDIVTALAALVALLPLLLVVALAIKLDSRGPVLFRQPRIGRQNRVFSIYKFRSMADDLCDTAGGQSTGRSDKRVTRVGRFIRRTSIDELPQLINVLQGEMSIVGPRPHAIASTAEGKLFWEVDGRYWSRHGCKPGITGLAQVNGYRGATEKAEDLINRVSSDLDYASRWSFTADIAIILRTCRILVHHNAY